MKPILITITLLVAGCGTEPDYEYPIVIRDYHDITITLSDSFTPIIIDCVVYEGVDTLMIRGIEWWPDTNVFHTIK